VRERQIVLSADTDADPRVDAEACRVLGIRSLVVVPIRRGEEVLGVIEVFSEFPYFFKERDVQRLVRLSHRIVECLASRLVDDIEQAKSEATKTSPERDSTLERSPSRKSPRDVTPEWPPSNVRASGELALARWP